MITWELEASFGKDVEQEDENVNYVICCACAYPCIGSTVRLFRPGRLPTEIGSLFL